MLDRSSLEHVVAPLGERFGLGAVIAFGSDFARVILERFQV